MKMSVDHLISSIDSDRRFSAAGVISFDVFDTLIFRRTPPGFVSNAVSFRLKSELEALGYIPVMPLSMARKEAYESVAATMRGGSYRDADCTLEEFLPEWIRRSAGCDDPRFAELANRMFAIEIDYEFRLTRPNVALLDKIKELKRAGRRIVYCSDMILGKKGIDSLLARHGYEGLFDAAYVSSDNRAFKWSGKLFDIMLHNENLSPEQLVHAGDNEYSDFRVPQRLGIYSILLSGGEAVTMPDDDLLEICHRFDSDAFSSDEAFGYESIGPIYSVFVHKTLELCRYNGIDRLYFVSRDGYLFMKMCERMMASGMSAAGFPQPLYLLLSRAAVFPAARKRLLKSDFSEWIAAKPGEETLFSCLSRYVPDETAWKRVRKLCGDFDFSAPLSISDLDRTTLASLFSDEELNENIRNSCEIAKQSLKEYLQRMGFFEGGRIGLADIGWSGSTQSLLAGIFDEEKDFLELFGFYFALTDKARNLETQKNHLVGVFAEQTAAGFYSGAVFSFLHGFESVSPAPHAGVVGFDPAGKPRFSDANSPVRQAERRNEKTVSLIQKGALRFASAYGLLASLSGISADESLPGAHFLAARLARFPSPEEAGRILSLQFSESFGPEKVNAIGETVLSENDSIHNRILALMRRTYRKSAWGRGIIELYRLPILGFAYSTGAAVKLLPDRGIVLSQKKECRSFPNSAASSSGTQWTPDDEYRRFLGEVENRFDSICNEVVHQTVFMAERPALKTVSAELELRASMLVVNALASLFGKEKYNNDGPPLDLKSRLRVPVHYAEKAKRFFLRLPDCGKDSSE